MSKPQLGVCYYPEHWPPEMWAQDAARMVDAGLSWVRIGEFAWSRIEAAPGVFTWDWLDAAVSCLKDAGLKLVMGTPSATPPRWMLDACPDMLAYDVEGRSRGFGSRRHYCFSDEGYRARAADMAGRLAARYANQVDVWQTDNEYGCHDTVLSYSPVAEAAFRVWLEDKYKTIDGLNAAWGNIFWSMTYRHFKEIALPNLTVTEPNPAHVMDFRRFSSDQVLAWDAAQVAAIRTYSDAPISHNYMGRVLEFDHFALGQTLEIATWDSYPLGFLEDRVPATDAHRLGYARQGDPDFQAFHHDLYRAVGTDSWWVMEQQPGPVNWAPWNPAPALGMVKLWTWEAIAHGADVVSYFRWRQAPFAQEQMHSGLNGPNIHRGPDSRPAMDEIANVATALKAMEGMDTQMDTQAAPLAIVFDYASQWAWETQPQGANFDYFELVFDLYRQLRQRGYNIDILPSTTRDFGARGAVFIPALFAWTDDLTQAVAQAQCPVILGPRAGTKTPDFSLSQDAYPAESLRPGLSVPWMDGGGFEKWRDIVPASTFAILSCDDGHPALLSDDNVYTLCGWPDTAGWSRVLDTLGLEVAMLPKGVRRRTRGTVEVWYNYGAQRQDISIHGKNVSIPAAGVILYDGKTVEIV